MGLQIRRVPSLKYKLLTTFVATLALVAYPLYGAASRYVAHAAPSGTDIVRSTALGGWNSGSASGGATNFVTDSGAPYGSGALELTTNSTNTSRAQRTKLLNPNIKLSDVTALSYSTKYVSGPVHAGAALQITINGLTGTSSSTTLVYEPYWNGTVDTSGAWQQWNALSGGKFWSSTTVAGFTAGAGGPPFYTIPQVLAMHPNAKITSIKLNIGTYNPGWVVRADGVRLNSTIYDFEPVANPVVNGENFNTHSGSDYKGLNVGFNIADFGTVSAISVALYKDDTVLATNTSNAALLALANGGTTQLSTPFITQTGSYVEEYWNLGAHSMTPATKPTKAVVTVTGANGTRSATLSSLVEPNGWVYESLFAPAKPVHESPSADALINYNDFYFDWNDVSGAVSYEMQNSTNPATDASGSFQNVMWTGDYQHVQPNESRARSVGASGTWYWQVRAVDAYGNKSAWTEPWKVTIDVDRPSAPLLKVNGSNASTLYTNQYNVTAAWNQPTSDTVKYDYAYWNDVVGSDYSGEANAWIDPGVVSTSYAGVFNQGEGVHYIKVRAIDQASNASPWSNVVAVYYDKTKPVVTGSDESAYNPASFTVTAADENSGIKSVTANIYKYNELTSSYALFDSNSSTTQNPFAVSLSGLGEGKYYVRYNASDRAGNIAQTKQFYFTVDKTDPYAQVALSGGGASVIATLTSLSEQIKLPADWSLSDGVYTKNHTANGSYTVTIEDLAGNTFSIPYIVDSIDDIPPVVTINSNVTRNANGTYTISGTTSDSTDDVRVAINGGAPVAVAVTGTVWTLTTNFLLDGVYTISVVGVDQFGNTSTAVNSSFMATTPGGATLLPSAVALDSLPAAPQTTAPGVGATTTNNTVAAGQQESSVLGARDSKKQVAPTSAPIVEATQDGWKILGVAWYWWLAIIAALAALWWLLAAWRRRRNDEAAA